MTQFKHSLAVLVALALTACGQSADDSKIAIDNGVPASDVETLPADDRASAPAQTGAAAPNATMPAAMPTQIPQSFHGRWGINRADCTSTRGDAKGLLTIDGARLTFYESKGTLGKVLGATPGSFDASYGFMGEGDTWERVERLRLVDGRLQRRTDAAPGQEPPVNLTYERCGE